MGIVSFQLSTSVENGQTVTSRTENVWKPDTLVKKTTPGAYNWDAVANTAGTYNVSMHTDPFAFIGRAAYTLPAIGDCICSDDKVTGITAAEKDKVCAIPASGDLPSDGHDITVTGEEDLENASDTMQMSVIIVAGAFLVHKFFL